MLRAVVVDDSPTARSLIKGILERDPDIQVVGLAQDGVEAVELVQRLRPDVVTMDVMMPRMDGLAATKEIMITAPTPIVIVSISTRITEVKTAMNALRAGALTLVDKPVGPQSDEFEQSANHLIQTVKAMSQVKVVRHLRRRDTDEKPVGNRTVPLSPGIPSAVVAIAASTGGPPALQRCLCGLPSGFPAPILVVQHISTGFTDGFVAWLNGSVALNVKLAENGERLQAGTVYVAGEGRHLEVANDKIRLNDERPPIGGFRPSGTPLFESVAKEYGKSALAMILTGMGRDGVDGLRAIQQVGGRVLAQNEASCVVFGMPRAAIDEGLADDVLDIETMSCAVLRFVLPGVNQPTPTSPSRQVVPVRAPDESVSERS